MVARPIVLAPAKRRGLQTWAESSSDLEELVASANEEIRLIHTEKGLVESIDYKLTAAVGGYSGEIVPHYMAVIVFRR